MNSYVSKHKSKEEKIYIPIKTLEFGYVYPNSPVEFIDGFVCYESESYEYFASLRLQNVSDKIIKSVEICLLCYQYANIPYLKIPFIYSVNGKNTGLLSNVDEKKTLFGRKKQNYYIKSGAIFGNEILVPLPQSYFRKLEFELKNVVFENGEVYKYESHEFYKAKNYEKIAEENKFAYNRINVYQNLEASYPIKNIPIVEDNAWICCCGQKNIVTSFECLRCRRSLQWQKEKLNENYFGSVINKENSVHSPHLKNFKKATYFEGRKAYVNPAELEEKQKLIRKALENVELEEIEKAKSFKRTVKKIVALALVLTFLSFLLTAIQNIKG